MLDVSTSTGNYGGLPFDIMTFDCSAQMDWQDCDGSWIIPKVDVAQGGSAIGTDENGNPSGTIYIIPFSVANDNTAATFEFTCRMDAAGLQIQYGNMSTATASSVPMIIVNRGLGSGDISDAAPPNGTGAPTDMLPLTVNQSVTLDAGMYLMMITQLLDPSQPPADPAGAALWVDGVIHGSGIVAEDFDTLLGFTG